MEAPCGDGVDLAMECLATLSVEPTYLRLGDIAADLGLPAKRGQHHHGRTVGDLIGELRRRGFSIVTRYSRTVGTVAAIERTSWAAARVAAANYWACVHGEDR
ncbi:MAG: hypothetical protein U0990_09600 [Candidatus Nanopelagicales bacterium]|nr:hypothetical protein [Candidatus Nanopelagicales bacterium]